MSKKVFLRQSFSLLMGSVTCLFKNPKIFYPFAILAFVQLMIMQILFFAPRFPLSVFFGPIITRLRGAVHMHYPFNFDLLNHWFQSAQIVVFLFAASFFIAKAIMMVARINRGEPLGERMPGLSFKKYANIVVAFLVLVAVMFGFIAAYGILMRRAFQIASTSGIYFIIKQVVLYGAPYANLVFSVIATTLFAYMVPVIVLEDKNIFAAIIRNFQILASSFWAVLTLIAMASLLYLPVLLIRSNARWFTAFLDPEGWQVFVISGVLIMLFVDAVQYTAITLCYFLTKDE